MMDWLKKRLSPVKADAQRWTELSEVLQTTWDEMFSKVFADVANLRSIYTSSEAGQRKKLADYGLRYERNIDADHIPVMLAMRKLELLRKETELPTKLMVLRSIGSSGEGILQPLYALSDAPYGSRFYTEKELADLGYTIARVKDPGRQVDGTWQVADPTLVKLAKGAPYLTSRVTMEIDMAQLEVPPFLEQLHEDFSFIKPLRIVLDGIRYRISLEMSAKPRQTAALGMEKYLGLPTSLNLKVNGTWKIGTNVVGDPWRLDGTWRVNGTRVIGYQPLLAGIVHETIIDRRIVAALSMSKTLELGNFTIARLGEGSLRVNGTWRVGGNTALALPGGLTLETVCECQLMTGIEAIIP